MKKKVKLQLVGIDGNAFMIMGAWKKAARQQGWTPDEIDAVITDATSGDYDHLLSVLIDNTEDPEE